MSHRFYRTILLSILSCSGLNASRGEAKSATPERVISSVNLIVRDYDEALDYYAGKLGFHVASDQDVGGGRRWVQVAPYEGAETRILLSKATTKEDFELVGKQSGQHVFLILQTKDFWTDYRRMQEKGVKFLEAPRQEAYGTVAIFEDLYGNRWDLIQ